MHDERIVIRRRTSGHASFSRARCGRTVDAIDKETTPLFAPTEVMYLPLVVIDVSEQRSVRRRRVRSTVSAGSPRPSSSAGPSRASHWFASIRTNIVRLIPRQTGLPYEPAAR
jgi:hypothetical protein